MPGSRRRAGKPPPDRGESRREARQRRAETTDPRLVEDAAARLLEVRARSVDEVRRRLIRAGYPNDLVEAAISRLELVGYLDDAAFARAWLESRDRAHPRGEAALRRELVLKGVAPEVIAAALAERDARASGTERDSHLTASGPEGAGREGAGPQCAGSAGAGPTADERAAQRLLAARSAMLLRESDPLRRRRRAWALLARRGFDPAVCAAAVSAWLATAGPNGDADTSGEEAGPLV